jgi:predicted MFS family arabinose efflux permease
MSNATLDNTHRKRFKRWHVLVGLLAGLIMEIVIAAVTPEFRLL